MPNRLIRPGILTSHRVDALSPQAEVFYRRLMSVADDYGRADGDWRVLRAALFPLRMDAITEEQIEAWLGQCSQVLDGEDEPLVYVYYIGRKRYLEISNFGQRVRAESKFPSPVGRERESAFSASAQTDARASRSSAARATTPLSTPTPTPTPTPTEGSAEGNQETEELFDRLVAEYPEGGRGERRAAKIVFAEVITAEAAERGSTRYEVFAEIFGAVIRWKQYDYRWLAGKVHGLRRFLAERMWLENPQPVANGNGHPKPPPASKTAENLERLRKFIENSEEKKAHAHT